MSLIKVVKHGNKFVSFSITGHSGFSRHGTDIVCAAVSAVTQTSIIGLLRVANIAPVIIKKSGLLSVEIPLEVQERLDIFVILSTMVEGIRDLQKQFPKHISLEEVNHE